MNERRIKILQLLADGYVQKEIAAQMIMTRAELDRELDRIRVVFIATTTAQALAKAVSRGLIKPAHANAAHINS